MRAVRDNPALALKAEPATVMGERKGKGSLDARSLAQPCYLPEQNHRPPEEERRSTGGRKDAHQSVRKAHAQKALSQDPKSKVVDFVAQLEVKVGGVWQPVTRYDCAMTSLTPFIRPSSPTRLESESPPAADRRSRDLRMRAFPSAFHGQPSFDIGRDVPHHRTCAYRHVSRTA